MEKRIKHSLQWIVCNSLWMFILFFTSCGDDDEIGSPRPRGYFRISFPEKVYRPYNESCPFTFDIPQYANVIPDAERLTEPCWINVDFPRYKGRLHLTYERLNNNIAKYLEDSRSLAIKHQMKADAIDEKVVMSDSTKVYGLIYDIEGNAASNVQFYLTDSVQHFIRGALYFSASPNKDSLAPVVRYIRDDVFRMIDSFRWKKED